MTPSPLSQFIERLFPSRRMAALEAARRALNPRAIEIHSVNPVPPEAPEFHRIAFIFKDPPGPYSLQFYEAATGQDNLLATLAPGTATKYYESRDEATTRVIETPDGRVIRPR